MAATLVANAALDLATVLLFTYVGVLALRRSTDDHAQLAQRMFAVWWFSVAAVMLLAGLPTLLSAIGVEDVTLATTSTYVTAVALAIALWSLLYYLVYIYTGRRSALWTLAVPYAAFFVFELYYFSSYGQRHLETTAWSVRIVGERDPASWITITFGIALAVPVLLIVAGYAGLYMRTRDDEIRRRIALVSTGFLLWFGAVLVGFLLGWDRQDWFPVVYEAPGLVAGLLVAAAYRPTVSRPAA